MSRGTLIEPPSEPELSLEEWFALPEDVPGELVDGHLEEEEAPDYLHELLVAVLARLLGNWIFPQGGLVAGSEAKFAVGAGRGRKPDLTFYLPNRRRPPARGLGTLLNIPGCDGLTLDLDAIGAAIDNLE